MKLHKVIFWVLKCPKLIFRKLANLCHEHCSWRNLHVVPKLEVFQKSDPLLHAYVSINFKAYVSNWISWIQIPDNVLCDHIQRWFLFTNEKIVHEQ